MMPLENLKLLKRDMENRGWVIEAFNFNYRNVDYFVIVRLYEKKDTNTKFALLKLEFIQADNLRNTLLCPANAKGLMIDAQTLRNYFGIAWAENLGDILAQFTKYLGGFIPKAFSEVKPMELNQAIINNLNRTNNEGNYCYAVNKNSGTRSSENDNKTRILRPTLYERFKNDKTLSFWYSENESEEKTDAEIIRNFTERNKLQKL